MNKDKIKHLYEKLKTKEIHNLHFDENMYLRNLIDNDKLGLKLNYNDIEENFEGEDIDKLLKENYFFFTENSEKNIINNSDKHNNLLIEGENYFALKALIDAKVKVDVIYIDPPYNTGSNDFIYNDKKSSSEIGWVNQDDPFRHSKWLSFMKRRLILAKELLSDTGVIFVSIDDNEQAYLKVMMDEIFGEYNCLAAIIVQKKSGGGQAKSYYKGHDHLFIYTKNNLTKNGINIPSKHSQIKKININGLLYWYYPDSIRKMHGKFDRKKLKDGELNHRNVFLEDYRITFSKEKQKLIEDKLKSKEYITVPFKNEEFSANMIVKAELSNNIERKKLIYSIITAWTSEGQNTYENIMPQNTEGRTFDAPKPLSLMVEILKYNLPKNGIVLDFFAGTGTTAHAVMELNKQDGGNRKFILCTNNEWIDKKRDENKIKQYGNDFYIGDTKKINTRKYKEFGICRKVTYERLYRIIKGKTTTGNKDYKWIQENNPYDENLIYLQIDEPDNMVHKLNGEYEMLEKSTNLYKKEFNLQLNIKTIGMNNK